MSPLPDCLLPDTGEFFLWTANAALGLLAVLSPSFGYPSHSLPLKSTVGWLAGSLLGVVGICFVLMQAATGLEKRQAEKYGDGAFDDPSAEGYKEWVQKTWAGPTFKSKTQ